MTLELTKRQENILEKIIWKYIKEVQPISSNFLKEEYNLEISPATIRAELARLDEDGFLEQVHISGGRIPTNKAYRFFVDNLFKEDFIEFGKEEILKEAFEGFEGLKDISKFSYELTKILFSLSSNLVITYLENLDIFIKEDWQEAIKAPEFRNTKFLTKFIKLINEFEENIYTFKEKKKEEKIKIYIGRKNPLKEKEFSIIITEVSFPRKEKGILAILGPERMAYDKNISLLNSLTKLLEEN